MEDHTPRRDGAAVPGAPLAPDSAVESAVVLFDPVSRVIRHLSHPLAFATSKAGDLFPANLRAGAAVSDLTGAAVLQALESGAAVQAVLPGGTVPVDLRLHAPAGLSVLILTPLPDEAALLAAVPDDLPLAEALCAALPALSAGLGASGAALFCGAQLALAGGLSETAARVALAGGTDGPLVLRLSERRGLALVFTRLPGTPWPPAARHRASALRGALLDRLLAEAEAGLEAAEATGRRQALIRAELDHRIKNLLALVKSVVRQTAARAESVRDFASTLDGRLQALALAHDHSLTANGGTISALVAAEAALHNPGQIIASGPEIRLEPRAFGVLALVLHEMMTNAAKYGALSVPGGQLALSWVLADDRTLQLDWQENGGPAVMPPRRTGFGTRLIRSALEADLQGTATLSYPPTGMTARLTLPAGCVVGT